MTFSRFHRRDLLRTATAAASVAATAQLSVSSASPSSDTSLTIGMATTNFRTVSNAELADILAASGIRTAQLFFTQTDSNYWRYNGRNDLSDLTAARCRRIAETYRSAGITIHSLGVYTNLIHPDPTERKANLAYFESMFRVGEAMNVRTFITEAGHYQDPKVPVPPVEYHFQEQVWHTMVGTGRQLAALAKQYDSVVLFEPFFRHFLSSAKRTRLYLEAIDSPNIRALLDPANLLEVNDLEEMFTQLGPWIDCLHAKDRKLHVDRGVPAGQGDLDYGQFVKLAAKHTPQAPLILEYVGLDDYQRALTHLQTAIG